MGTLNNLKIYEYEITFQLSESIPKITLVTTLQGLLKYISQAHGIVTNIKLSLKTSKTQNKYKIHKGDKQFFNSENPQLNNNYLYTVFVKINPLLLKELLYNLKIRKLTSNIICVKHVKKI